MRVRRKVSPHRIGRRRNVRQMNVATMAVACIVLALAVDMFTPAADGASPAAAVERRAPEARVDTAFVAVREAPLADAPAVAPHAPSRCGDFDFSFLNTDCATAWKKRPARLHRPATFVAGTADAPSSSRTQAPPAREAAGPAKPSTVTAAASSDRSPLPAPPARKPKPAVTAGLAAAVQ
jgi:hypothetical protein